MFLMISLNNGKYKALTCNQFKDSILYAWNGKANDGLCHNICKYLNTENSKFVSVSIKQTLLQIDGAPDFKYNQLVLPSI
jgi:hypothetical protein